MTEGDLVLIVNKERIGGSQLPTLANRETRTNRVRDAKVIAEHMKPAVIVLQGIWGKRGQALVAAFRRITPDSIILVIVAEYSQGDAERFVVMGAEACVRARGANVHALMAAAIEEARERRASSPRPPSPRSMH